MVVARMVQNEHRKSKPSRKPREIASLVDRRARVGARWAAMPSRLFAALCVAVAIAAAGCRMADGPLPTPNSETLNRLDDLRRDLGNVVGGHQEARKDFADDLMVFVKPPIKAEAPGAVTELTRLLSDAATAAQVKEAAMPPLLRQVWTAVAAQELSERQVTTLQGEVKTTLTGLGVPEPSAQAISNQIGTVQKAVTGRTRRWYEVF
jgi:hypothetical protein